MLASEWDYMLASEQDRMLSITTRADRMTRRKPFVYKSRITGRWWCVCPWGPGLRYSSRDDALRAANGNPVRVVASV